MSLATIILFQITWFLAATAFNLLSYLALRRGQKGWAGPDAVKAQMGVLVFAAAIVLSGFGPVLLANLAALIVGLLLFLGGVVRHMRADPSTYASRFTLVAAVSVNLFGSFSFLIKPFFS